MKKYLIVLISCIALSACASAKVGSRAWCDKMDEKPKGDWTFTQTKDYAKHCVFK